MSFGLMEVFKNKTILNKLRDELDSVLGDKTFPNTEDMSNMPYLDALFKETLRVHPPGSMSLRTAPRKVETSTGTIHPGDQVFLLFAPIHFDPTIYENPTEFRPERFVGKKITPHLHAFGGGPRICIGRDLAKIEVRTVMSAILKKYNLEITNKIVKKTGFTTYPDGGMWVRVTHR